MLLLKLNERYDPEDIASLYRCAAAWTAARGEMPESLGYLLALGDIEASADLPDSRRIALLNRRQYPVAPADKRSIEFIKELWAQALPSSCSIP